MSGSTSKIKGVVFDVNETLISLGSLTPRFLTHGLVEDDVQVWFLRVLRDGIASGATGSFATFKEIGIYHAMTMLAAKVDMQAEQQEAAALDIVSGMSQAQVFPDVAPAFIQLKAAGLKVATMTNGSIQITRQALQASEPGLLRQVDVVMEVSQPGLWKPRAECYHYAAKQLGLQPEEVMLVAVHPWDCHGAKQAGLQAAYIDRGQAQKTSFPPFFQAPDLQADSLVALTSQIISADQRVS